LIYVHARHAQAEPEAPLVVVVVVLLVRPVVEMLRVVAVAVSADVVAGAETDVMDLELDAERDVDTAVKPLAAEGGLLPSALTARGAATGSAAEAVLRDACDELELRPRWDA
jgi:hypothetical protein